ncbi:Gti1/Pac2 family-domain-containing protein [Nemania sp. FL0031]|nr:Gti1/Pac2 family-domain-containing protein [Nemania sp. FL0031]
MSNQPSGSQASPLEPTFKGFISCTMDALILFEACLSGHLAHVSRRPHDRERTQLIQSGNVFIYEEHSSGIKRWTDGMPWSPSRILGNFLLYRELDKPFQPGEKKRAMKRSKTDGVSKSTPNPRGSSISNYAGGVLNNTPTTLTGAENATNRNEVERAYVGSLVDSYQFKENGLVKKTISVLYKGVHHHLVSYYSIKDITDRVLKTVHDSPDLAGIVPRPTLIQAGNFRSPVDDNEFGVLDPKMFTSSEYGLPNATPVRSMSIPTPSMYGHQWGANYGHSQGYSLPQTLQSSVTYGQPTAPSFTYESAYGPSRQYPFTSGPMVQASRRHSLVPSTSQYGYPMSTSTLLPQGSSLTSHGLSSMSYMNGEVFGASAANAAAESAAAGPAADYGTAGTMGHSNVVHSMGNSIPHSTAGFDGQLTSSYENSIGRLTINDFGDSLQDPEGSNFGPASTTTTPTNMPLGLEHPELSPADQQWNRTPSNTKHEW